MSTKISPHHIDIDVRSQFIRKMQLEAQWQYQFAYEITIRNLGQQQVQLLRRHWWISNQFDETQEVEGEGVVGKQPILPPNTQFVYNSGSVLNTPIGTMKGTYFMVDDEQNHFDVEIPLFVLAAPGQIH